MNAMGHTKSLCVVCGAVVDAEIVEKQGKVFLVKRCEAHGQQETLISADVAWYRDAMSFDPVSTTPKRPHGLSGMGCPYDCGLCESHRQKVFLPVVPITSACNLSCPVCYTLNRNVDPFFMSLASFASILDQLREVDPALPIINFTGGEPLMHPEFGRMVEMCHAAGIHRVTVSTNGLRLLTDERLLADLCRFDARIVLSWNSFEREPYRVLAGADLLDTKMKILDLLGRYRPTTTLLTVVAAGLNDGEIGPIVNYVMESDFIISSEIHTITFSGQNEHRLDHNLRTTPPDIIRRITEHDSRFTRDDFIPSPCAHPLCYSVCYALKLDPDTLVPLARLLSRRRLHTLLAGQLYMEPGPATEDIFREVIDDLWLNEDSRDDGVRLLKQLKRMMETLSASQTLDYHARQRHSERFVKAIYIHSHMDAENFDCERIRHCCVAVPSGEQRFIPTCSYNNIYRARDPRFAARQGDSPCVTT